MSITESYDSLCKNHASIDTLYASWIETPLAPMLAISDHNKLLLLEFEGRKGLKNSVNALKRKGIPTITEGTPPPIQSIQEELSRYFSGQLQTFTTPIHMPGSPFQQQVWHTLMKVPYGHTWSYGEQAKVMGRPSATRAVANANGANQFSILIPCHRIIRSNGDLGGYGGGLDRKIWLLAHEKKHSHKQM